MKKSFDKYFSEESFWKKILDFSKQAGAKVIYAGLLLFYTLKDKSLPLKNRLIIMSALGYFILPTDGIIDLTPVIGYSDDLGVLLFALSQLSGSISEETRLKARTKLKEWFGDLKEEELDSMDGEIL